MLLANEIKNQWSKRWPIVAIVVAAMAVSLAVVMVCMGEGIAHKRHKALDRWHIGLTLINCLYPSMNWREQWEHCVSERQFVDCRLNLVPVFREIPKHCTYIVRTFTTIYDVLCLIYLEIFQISFEWKITKFRLFSHWVLELSICPNQSICECPTPTASPPVIADSYDTIW